MPAVCLLKYTDTLSTIQKCLHIQRFFSYTVIEMWRFLEDMFVSQQDNAIAIFSNCRFMFKNLNCITHSYFTSLFSSITIYDF